MEELVDACKEGKITRLHLDNLSQIVLRYEKLSEIKARQAAATQIVQLGGRAIKAADTSYTAGALALSCIRHTTAFLSEIPAIAPERMAAQLICTNSIPSATVKIGAIAWYTSFLQTRNSANTTAKSSKLSKIIENVCESASELPQQWIAAAIGVIAEEVASPTPGQTVETARLYFGVLATLLRLMVANSAIMHLGPVVSAVSPWLAVIQRAASRVLLESDADAGDLPCQTPAKTPGRREERRGEERRGDERAADRPTDKCAQAREYLLSSKHHLNAAYDAMWAYARSIEATAPSDTLMVRGYALQLLSTGLAVFAVLDYTGSEDDTAAKAVKADGICIHVLTALRASWNQFLKRMGMGPKDDGTEMGFKITTSMDDNGTDSASPLPVAAMQSMSAILGNVSRGLGSLQSYVLASWNVQTLVEAVLASLRTATNLMTSSSEGRTNLTEISQHTKAISMALRAAAGEAPDELVTLLLDVAAANALLCMRLQNSSHALEKCEKAMGQDRKPALDPGLADSMGSMIETLQYVQAGVAECKESKLVQALLTYCTQCAGQLVQFWKRYPASGSNAQKLPTASLLGGCAEEHDCGHALPSKTPARPKARSSRTAAPAKPKRVGANGEDNDAISVIEIIRATLGPVPPKVSKRSAAAFTALATPMPSKARPSCADVRSSVAVRLFDDQETVQKPKTKKGKVNFALPEDGDQEDVGAEDKTIKETGRFDWWQSMDNLLLAILYCWHDVEILGEHKASFITCLELWQKCRTARFQILMFASSSGDAAILYRRMTNRLAMTCSFGVPESSDTPLIVGRPLEDCFEEMVDVTNGVASKLRGASPLTKEILQYISDAFVCGYNLVVPYINHLLQGISNQRSILELSQLAAVCHRGLCGLLSPWILALNELQGSTAEIVQIADEYGIPSKCASLGLVTHYVRLGDVDSVETDMSKVIMNICRIYALQCDSGDLHRVAADLSTCLRQAKAQYWLADIPSQDFAGVFESFIDAGIMAAKGHCNDGCVDRVNDICHRAWRYFIRRDLDSDDGSSRADVWSSQLHQYFVHVTGLERSSSKIPRVTATVAALAECGSEKWDEIVTKCSAAAQLVMNCKDIEETQKLGSIAELLDTLVYLARDVNLPPGGQASELVDVLLQGLDCLPLGATQQVAMRLTDWYTQRGEVPTARKWFEHASWAMEDAGERSVLLSLFDGIMYGLAGRSAGTSKKTKTPRKEGLPGTLSAMIDIMSQIAAGAGEDTGTAYLSQLQQHCADLLQYFPAESHVGEGLSFMMVAFALATAAMNFAKSGRHLAAQLCHEYASSASNACMSAEKRIRAAQVELQQGAAALIAGDTTPFTSMLVLALPAMTRQVHLNCLLMSARAWYYVGDVVKACHCLDKAAALASADGRWVLQTHAPMSMLAHIKGTGSIVYSQSVRKQEAVVLESLLSNQDIWTPHEYILGLSCMQQVFPEMMQLSGEKFVRAVADAAANAQRFELLRHASLLLKGQTPTAERSKPTATDERELLLTEICGSFLCGHSLALLAEMSALGPRADADTCSKEVDRLLHREVPTTLMHSAPSLIRAILREKAVLLSKIGDNERAAMLAMESVGPAVSHRFQHLRYKQANCSRQFRSDQLASLAYFRAAILQTEQASAAADSVGSPNHQQKQIICIVVAPVTGTLLVASNIGNRVCLACTLPARPVIDALKMHDELVATMHRGLDSQRMEKTVLSPLQQVANATYGLEDVDAEDRASEASQSHAVVEPEEIDETSVPPRKGKGSKPAEPDKRAWWNRRYELEAKFEEAVQTFATGFGNIIVSGLQAEDMGKTLAAAVDNLSMDKPSKGRRSAKAKAAEVIAAKETNSEYAWLLLCERTYRLPWEQILRCSGAKIPHLLRTPTWKVLKSAAPVAGDTRRGLFSVINPGGDLKKTEERLSSTVREIVDAVGGKCILGAKPSPEVFWDNFSQAKVYLYAGHGAGEKLLSRHGMLSEASGPVALLMGCSSGKLDPAPECAGEPFGPAMALMASGCHIVAGNLWDVTDKDIDALTCQITNSWVASYADNECEDISVLKEIDSAREKCKLRRLNGEAVICYSVQSS